jgi:hypothetical protein
MANAVSGTGQPQQAQQPKMTAAQKEAAAKGTPKKEEAPPNITVQGQIDHAALNHTREKDGNHKLSSFSGRTEARGSTPWPADITQEDERVAAEMIRTTDKADILVKWRKDERASDEPRQSIIDLIYQKLLRVQGPPLPPE